MNLEELIKKIIKKKIKILSLNKKKLFFLEKKNKKIITLNVKKVSAKKGPVIIDIGIKIKKNSKIFNGLKVVISIMNYIILDVF